MTTKTSIKRIMGTLVNFSFTLEIIFMAAWVKKKKYIISDPESRHIDEASKFYNI